MDQNNETKDLMIVETTTTAENTTASVEGTVEGTEGATVIQDAPTHEYWYQKIGRSVGASIGICASALVVVALTAGISAFAGAQAASDGDSPKSAHMAQLMKDDETGRRTLDSADGLGAFGKGDMSTERGFSMDRGTDSGTSRGTMPDMSDSKGQMPDAMPGVDQAPDKSQAPDMSDMQTERSGKGATTPDQPDQTA